jgi:hypothetical protein
MKNKKVEIKSSEPNIVVIDGEEYILEREKVKKIDGVEHSDKLIFKPYKKEEFIKDLYLIVDTLAKHTTKKELLKNLIKDIDYKTMRRLALRIRKKKPIKKQKGCLGFKIGDAYVQLID